MAQWHLAGRGADAISACVGAPAHDQTTGIAMHDEDRAAIIDLFQRLREVEGRAGPRDPDAEALIHAAIADQPGAPYYMAQTIVVQNAALQEAERRIAALEARAAEAESGAGGLFGGLFGSGAGRGRGGSVPPVGRRQAAESQAGGSGGGFLAGAAQTAMGVAGGVLLGNMIGGALFGSDTAAAAEPPPADDMGNEDPGAGDFGEQDLGGGDFGDFDLGDF